MLTELLVSGALTCRPAVSREEMEAAFRLVYLNYLQRGYIEKDPSGMRLTGFNALPEATTIVGVLRGQVVATVTMIADSPAGLPMDEIYREELDGLRCQGRRLVEISMLADRRQAFERSLEMVQLLMKRVFDLATLVLGADDLVITINPRHDIYYERRLLFQPMGAPRAYPSVRHNPALAKRLDLRTVEERCAGNILLLDRFFSERTPENLLRSKFEMAPEDMRYFFVERTSAFRDAPDKVMSYLRKVRPDCPWSAWGREAVSTG